MSLLDELLNQTQVGGEKPTETFSASKKNYSIGQTLLSAKCTPKLGEDNQAIAEEFLKQHLQQF